MQQLEWTDLTYNQDNSLLWFHMIIKNLRTLIYRKYSRLTLPWHIMRAVNLWYLLRVIQSSVGHQNILLSDWVKYLVSPEGWARWSVPQL